MADLKSLIRTIPDYPKPGIMFRDVTTLFGDAQGFKATLVRMAEPWRGEPVDARGMGQAHEECFRLVVAVMRGCEIPDAVGAAVIGHQGVARIAGGGHDAVGGLVAFPAQGAMRDVGKIREPRADLRRFQRAFCAQAMVDGQGVDVGMVECKHMHERHRVSAAGDCHGNPRCIVRHR